MRKLVILLLFIFTSFYSFGQIGEPSPGQIISSSNFGFIQGNHLPDDFLRSGSKTISYGDIEGSPYIKDNQKKINNIPIGKLFSSELELIGTLYIRYNAFTDNMEVSKIDDGVDYYLLKKEPDSYYIDLGENRYRAYNYLLNQQSATGFFVVLTENDSLKYALLKKEKVIFKDAVKQRSSFVTDSPAVFKKQKDSYYLKFEEKLTLIPRKEKDFLKLFPERKESLKEYIKSNKHKITVEKDLLAIISYYNTLLN